MGVIEGRTWTELLSPERCWEAAATTVVGRLAVIIDGAPEIYPVNYVVDERTIVFRTGPGTKLRAAAAAPVVTFEVDSVDEARRMGWSVVIQGRAKEITDPAELRQVSERGLEVWTPAERPVWIRITPTRVTGRGIRARWDEPEA
jgi:nitroimidazol reductase NimA-like FMN-containing flavoprotein (pyridoxamine 5'-phosphate oxidase superfamily)